MDRRRFLELMAATGLTVTALGGFATLAQAQTVSGLMDDLPLPDQTLGDKNAPVTIVEYASMTCPHCKNFHENVLPELKKRYIDTGKVYFIMREFAWDPRARAAFMLARCAPNNNYFPMVDVLFQQQELWSYSKDPARDLLQISKLAGFTEKSFNACLTNQKLLDDINAVKTRGETKFGVTATPTLFINNEKFSGDFAIKRLSAAIDAHL